SGSPDDELLVNGRDFSSNTAITFLLDGKAAPGAPKTQSDAKGTFTVKLTITDDWAFGRRVLTAKDAQNYVTNSGVTVTIVPQPVLAVDSNYHASSTPAGTQNGVFQINGKRFAPDATVTLQLDGGAVPDAQPITSDHQGRFSLQVETSGAW